MTAALESALRRDRWIVAGSLGGITMLAWWYTLWLAQPGNMACSMPDMAGMSMASPDLHAWSAGDFAFMFAMWAVMMVGMMTPSAAPMILVHARVARHAAAQGNPLAATGWFAAGYLFSWCVFSLAATVLQAAFEGAAAMDPAMALASPRIGGAVLVVAGIWQWTSVKDACLNHCRAPLNFIQSHGGFQKRGVDSFRLGASHGFYCIGCCWALMALLFAVGVMNVAWIAALSVLVLLEKIAPGGRLVARTAGVLLVAGGLAMALAG